MDDALCYMSAVELAANIRSGEISPVEVVDAVIAQINRHDTHINAFITRSDDLARQTARAVEATLLRDGAEALGPLAGIPISIKDLTPTAGVRTTFGVAEFADHVPDTDAPVVARIHKAGAVLIGKNSTPGFGWMGVTENEIIGTTNNPWALDHSVGGSSGGAAAALAAGFGPLATGSDGGGSIRIPAALCGIVGHRPSIGRVPRGRESLLFDTVDVLGPMTRTVADAALLLSVMAGPVEDEPFMLPEEGVSYVSDLRADAVRGLRVAYSPDLGHGPVDTEIAAIVLEAVTHFERTLGASVTPVDIDIPDPLAYFNDYYSPSVTGYADAHPGVQRMFDKYPNIGSVGKIAENVSAAAWWQNVMPARQRTFLELARIFQSFDILVTPTMPVVAWQHDMENGPLAINGIPVEFPHFDYFRFTEPTGHTGHPAITINCGFTRSGLPVGLHITGRQRDDHGVLRAAAAYEATTDWHKRRPPALV